MAKIRIAYFESKPGKDDVSEAYDVDVKLGLGEQVVGAEIVQDGGYNTNWHRVYILVPE